MSLPCSPPSDSDPIPGPVTDIRRKRLIFRSWHRGTREADLLLGNFADSHLRHLDAAQLDRYEALLSESDPDLYDWINGTIPVPATHDHDVMALLQGFRFAAPSLTPSAAIASSPTIPGSDSRDLPPATNPVNRSL
ncbi:MAG: succinate dehydrogenase assembly factor 2 [Azospirillaceae bacterium]|nr:succinate dehydrogenase assembly factor 2 [Azospirillaceae bacterium]